MQPNLQEAKEWAAEAGEILCQKFTQRHQVRMKGKFDLVTEADTASEALLIDRIRTHYPEDKIISEESGLLEGNGGGTWYIDPLDGTINYAHGMPIFSVTLAYAEHNRVLLGVVYDPWRGEFFTAERGKGAFLNGEQIFVSEAAGLTESLLVTGFPYDAWNTSNNNLDNYGRFARLTQGVRRLGSAALDMAYVAAGRLDGYWEIIINPWDIAAGTLLVEEAGGLVTNTSGERDYMKTPYSIVAANPTIHAGMMAVLRQS